MLTTKITLTGLTLCLLLPNMLHGSLWHWVNITKKINATKCSHVLRPRFPPVAIRKYDLWPWPHNFTLPDKDDSNYIARILYKTF